MVEILLAVYNGEKYLKEQLDSILCQSYEDWRLLIYDDGSYDKTQDIIKDYIKKIDGRIKYYRSEKNGGSAKESFSKLLSMATEQYICFCDHDDVWHKDKLKVSLQAMKRMEDRFKNLPILIHTDLFVVDSNLKLIKKSMVKSQKLQFKEKSLKRLIVQNNITGCTVLINDKLKEICGKIPRQALMHDWWLGLVAAAFGRIKFLKTKTVYYRQHENNCVGALDVCSFKYILKKMLNKKETIKSIKDCEKQCICFFKIYEKILPKKSRMIVKRYLKIRRYGKVRRVFSLAIGGYLKNGLIRKIGQMFYI